jgi:hypothetical protein
MEIMLVMDSECGKDCIFSKGKSQEMGLVGVFFVMFQSFLGATPVQPAI